MHNTIFKYELNLVERQDLFLPRLAKIISAQTQREKVCIWAMVDTNEKKENRTIAIVGTGNPLPKINPDEKMVHIDTVQMHSMVWHVFEIVQKQIV
jgi:hypothetical protein